MAGTRAGHPSDSFYMDGRVKPGHDMGDYLLITVTRPTLVSPAIRLS